MTKEWVSLGQLGKPFGIKGWLRLNVRETVLCELKTPISLKLSKPDFHFPEKEITLLEIRPHGGKFIVRFEGVTTPEEAAKWIGGFLFLPQKLLPKIETKNEFYITDLIGLQAIDESGKKLDWKLKDVQDNPAHPILVFVKENGEEILIPFLQVFVGDLDLEKNTIVLIQPEIWNEI
ncbi:16S rRNA processing protein RimM [Leptospira interrogans]|uniref:ribosome maturation factor RimM n=1 Tax=Leptospira interrogans TaxID=173 RepID=UPI0002B9FCB1|nr:ribosome maturation factor RimM [Leptospira interrogans]KAA1292104.1 ribosome maturation factor RimM [Leptospira interrogans serovar Geyaweera]QCO37581.1 16S rRNA processing protein RimM [Leptospira interrogans]QCO40878.1 16S rRNA processing protein RimM [Leptospira interrogans]ULG93185.1 ribosome maturation factor RimM [Leptospira interrogans]